MDNENVLLRIKALCIKHGTNITELERTLGFSKASMTKWGSSSPTITKLAKVADFFGVSTDFLLGRTEIASTVDQAISDQNIVTIQRLRSRLSVRDNEKMMQMLRVQFAEDFPEEDG